jgi:hypothetical protein
VPVVVIASAPIAIVIPTVVVAAVWGNHGRDALPHCERPPWTAMAMAQLVRYNNCGNLKLMLSSQLRQQQQKQLASFSTKHHVQRVLPCDVFVL